MSCSVHERDYDKVGMGAGRNHPAQARVNCAGPCNAKMRRGGSDVADGLVGAQQDLSLIAFGGERTSGWSLAASSLSPESGYSVAGKNTKWATLDSVVWGHTVLPPRKVSLQLTHVSSCLDHAIRAQTKAIDPVTDDELGHFRAFGGCRTTDADRTVVALRTFDDHLDAA